MITITYYGHSCFKVENENHAVVFDPYEDGSVPGLKLPSDIHADAVYCSHSHADHDASSLIHITSDHDPFPLHKITVPHDDAGGTKRGFTDITFVTINHVTIAHLGDIGRMPTKEEYDELSKADVIMIPCGGYFTIDAKQAEEIIHHVHAKLNILMHYREDNRGYDVIADIKDIQKDIPELVQLNDSSISFDEANIPQETITLKPIQ